MITVKSQDKASLIGSCSPALGQIFFWFVSKLKQLISSHYLLSYHIQIIFNDSKRLSGHALLQWLRCRISSARAVIKFWYSGFVLGVSVFEASINSQIFFGSDNSRMNNRLKIYLVQCFQCSYLKPRYLRYYCGSCFQEAHNFVKSVLPLKAITFQHSI